MFNTSLYQEAIAEAKQLRETAEVNAKNAIIEAVTPKIRQFIEDQLLNEDKGENEQDVLESVVGEIFEDAHINSDEEVSLDEGALSALLELMMSDNDTISKNLQGVKDRSNIIDAINETLEDMSPGDRGRLQAVINDLKIEKNLTPDDIVISEDSQSENFEEIIEMSNVEKDETLYEVDLDEIAALLDDELGSNDSRLDELDAMLTLTPDSEEEEAMAAALDDLLSDLAIDVEVAGAEEEEVEDIDVEDELDVDMDVDVEDVEDVDVEEEDVTLDEIFEIDIDVLKDELRKIRLAEAGELATSGKKHPKGDVFGGKPSDHPSGDDFGGGKRGKDALSTKLNQISEAYVKENRKNRVLSEKLNEYRGAVKTLREQLTEMNLFNAKLLYVNKLLQQNNVTPKQRRNIIEALDDARTLREVKLLFKSLTKSLDGQPKKQLSESVRRTLGSSSRTTHSASSSDKPSDEVNRWAKLAGLPNK